MTAIDSPPAPATAKRGLLAHPAAVPLVVGIVAAALSSIAVGVPSMWGDEAASVMSARRSWSSLADMATNVDAVHVVYYAFLHVWVDVFGASAFSVRLPSALAVGATVAGAFVLCRGMIGSGWALVAAAACLLIPRVGYMATEARSAAFAAALATWLTVLVVHAVRRQGTVRHRRRLWILYGVVLVVSVLVFLYSALIALVHAATLVALRADRAVWRRWALACVAAGVACLPFVLVSMGQHGQIAFLARRDVTSPHAILVGQWFSTLPVAIVCWSLIGIALVSSLRRPPRAESEQWRDRLIWVAAAWLLFPMGALLLANVVAGPLYTGRYLSFSAPAAGILVACGIAAVRARWIRAVAAVAVLAVAVPVAVSQRGEHAKFGSDWAQVSALVGAHSAPGDGVVFDESVRPSRKPRLALQLYPDGFRNTTDLALVRPYDETAGLWDEVTTLERVRERWSGTHRVWVIARSRHGTSADEETLRASGFTLQSTHELARDTVMLYTREEAGTTQW